MRSIMACGGAAALFLTMATAPAANAEAVADTYHGTWTSADVCGTSSAFTGNWNVVLGDRAEVHITTFLDGRHHVSWGGEALRGRGPLVQDPDPAPYVFRLTRGDQTFTLDEAGNFTYTITAYPYCEGGPQDVTMHGTLTH